VLFEPRRLGSKSIAASIERPELWTTDRRKIRNPASVRIGFYV
jgi:hypothetical protein